MEEDIKILEEWLLEMQLLYKQTYINNVKETTALENLIKGYRELERKFKIKTGDVEYLENKINKHFIDDVTLQRDYIPKSKVKEKIEKIIKSNPKQSEDWDGTDYEVTPEESFAIEILEELMEDK